MGSRTPRDRPLVWGAILLLALAAGCALRAEPVTGPSLAGARAEHFAPNRCGDVAETPCRRDSDCPRGPCVSVLPSDAGAFGRDGGHSVAVGDLVLWQFGDSFAVDGMLSATAAWSRRDEPLPLTDAVESDGKPIQFLPFTPREQAEQAARFDPPPCCYRYRECPEAAPYCMCPDDADCAVRLALWPGDGVASDSETATVVYDRQVVGVAPYDFTSAGIGVATVRRGAAIAERALDDEGEPVLVFSGDEPQFLRGMLVDDGDGRYFYLYGTANRHGCSVDVLLARVPPARMADRDAYRFWNGEGWSATLAQARPVAAGITAGLGSVGWNAHLGAYLAVWSDICTGGSVLELRAAPAPQGPWSDAARVDLTPLGARADAYYGMAHPEFGDGRDVLVTYFQPLEGVYGQMRLLRLILP